MKKLLLFLFLIIVSCAKEEEDNQPLPAALNYELAENIIGKWDIQNSAKKAATCRVFNVVFSQNEFIINYTGGQIKGTYTVDSETKISLTSTGDITNIFISNGNISFNISIDNCDVSANGVKDNNYIEGECTTLLECLDNIYYGDDDEFFVFFDDPTGDWFKSYYFGNCIDIESPSNFDGEFQIIQNEKYILLTKLIRQDGEIEYFKFIRFDDNSFSLSRSETFDGDYEIDNNYVPLSQAKVFELQSILESSQECSDLSNSTQNCNQQDIIDLFNSLKEINIGGVKEFSFGNYYKTWESDATPIEGTFGGITYTQINFNEVNELNGIGNEISFYFRKDTGDILMIISLNSVLENGIRTYTNLRRFYAPNYASDGPLNYEHSSYCELWDAASNFTNDLPKQCTYNGESTTGGNPLNADWAILTNTTTNTTLEGREGRLEIVPSGGNGTYAYRWEFKPAGSNEIIQIDKNSGLLIPNNVSEIPSNMSTTGSYTVYIYEGSLNQPCPALKKSIQIVYDNSASEQSIDYEVEVYDGSSYDFYDISYNYQGNNYAYGSNINLEFNGGDKILFKVYSPSYPFYIKKTLDVATYDLRCIIEPGINVDENISNNGTGNGEIIWTPTTPGIYYYQSPTYSRRVGLIIVNDENGNKSNIPPGAIGSFRNPSKITIDKFGNLFVAETNKIKWIDTYQRIRTIAGQNENGNSVGNGLESTKFKNIRSITVDENGIIYLSDDGGLKKLTPIGIQYWSSFVSSNITYPGQLLYREGYLYINDRGTIWKKNVDTGEEEIYVSSQTSNPNSMIGSQMVFDSKGTLFYGTSSGKIDKIDSNGTISSFVGNGDVDYEQIDGSGTNIGFGIVGSLAIDSNDNIIFSDYVLLPQWDNDSQDCQIDGYTGKHLIRKITPDGVSTIIAGGEIGYKNGQAINSKFLYPEGIIIDTDDNIYIADKLNNVIRKIDYQNNVSTYAGSFFGEYDTPIN